MQVSIFLGISLLVNLALSYLVQVRDYKNELRIPIWGLGILLPIDSAIGYWAVNSSFVGSIVLGTRVFMALNVFVHLFMIELISHFFSDDNSSRKFSLAGFSIPSLRIWRFAAPLIALVCFFPNFIIPFKAEGQNIYIHFSNLLIPLFQLIMMIYALYVLENTYRFAEEYQRKIGRLCFLAIGILCGYQLFLYSRILLYSSFPSQFMDISSVIYSVTYPIMMGGFIRYRLGAEKVFIPRNVVYTSATLFLTGAMFLGVACTAFLFRWLEIDFSYFWNFLLAFSLCFFIFLTLGSGTMRKRIIRLVNKTIYTQKYDYREQFFRLHKTIMSGTNLGGTVTELVENMKYSVTVDDAFVFFRNWLDGNFYFQENKEQATYNDYVILCESSLVKALEDKKTKKHFVDKSKIVGIESNGTSGMSTLAKLKIDAVFPIWNRDQLLGILALRGKGVKNFEEEDLELIQVFTNSLGDVIFKNRVLTERIEQKQFESFNHISSFIIHDIKNQIATLSLIMSNAENKAHDPEFQKSMLNSIKNCSKNLQVLIGKLTVIPKKDELVMVPQHVNSLIEEVIENSGLDSLENLELTLEIGQDVVAQMDRQSLYFVLKNLIQNALDAMFNQGTISVTSGVLNDIPEKLKIFHGGGPSFFSVYNSYILVKDSGPGMSEDYINTKLFRPFSTTKEKGVGIGLYQSKSLIEEMGGKILCHSKLKQGTTFCILLK